MIPVACIARSGIACPLCVQIYVIIDIHDGEDEYKHTGGFNMPAAFQCPALGSAGSLLWHGAHCKRDASGSATNAERVDNDRLFF